MIITKKLQDVIHDANLCILLAAAVETERHEDSPELRALRDYLVHNGLADYVATPVERVRSVWDNDEEKETDE